jgi:hypothetical protein
VVADSHRDIKASHAKPTTTAIHLFVGLLLWVALVLRGMWPALQEQHSRSLILLVAVATVAIGLLFGAGLMYGKDTHISIMEYWRQRVGQQGDRDITAGQRFTHHSRPNDGSKKQRGGDCLRHNRSDFTHEPLGPCRYPADVFGASTCQAI